MSPMKWHGNWCSVCVDPHRSGRRGGPCSHEHGRARLTVRNVERGLVQARGQLVRVDDAPAGQLATHLQHSLGVGDRVVDDGDAVELLDDLEVCVRCQLSRCGGARGVMAADAGAGAGPGPGCDVPGAAGVAAGPLGCCWTVAMVCGRGKGLVGARVRGSLRRVKCAVVVVVLLRNKSRGDVKVGGEVKRKAEGGRSRG